MKKFSFLLQKYYISLFFILLFSCFFIFQMYKYQTIFGYDMARDAFEANSIVSNHDLKILGPGTDIKGLNHGVLWYYFLSIPYLIANHDPQLAVLFFIFLYLVTVIFVWYLSYELFKDRKLSFVTVVIYSFSPFSQALSSWMSNPVPCLYITPILLIFLWHYLNKKDIKKAFIIGLLFGLLIQFQLANALFLIFIPVYLLLFKTKPSIREIIFFLTGFLLAISTYIVAELKFKERGILALLDFLKNHHVEAIRINDLTNKFFNFFQLNFFPFQSFLAILLVVIILIFSFYSFKKFFKQQVFLMIWISNIILFALFRTGVSTSSFVFIPSIAVGAIILSFVIVKFIKNKFVLALCVFLILLFQINMHFSWFKKEYNPLAVQRSNTTYRYEQVIDYTYEKAEKKAFIINTITDPLYINTTWAYLYQYYGKEKYGYLPFWGGKDQTGYLGNLPAKPFGENLRYLIIESTIGIPYVYISKIKYEEEKVSDLVEEKHFGFVVVQKRKFHEGKRNIPIPDDLKNSQILYE